MTRDAKLTFCDSLDLTGLSGADDGASTTDIDLVAAAPEIAAGGRTPYIWVNIEVSLTGTGATVDFQLEDSPDDSSYTDVAGVATGALALTAMTAGDVVLDMPLPDGLARYLRLNLVNATADVTAGACTAFIYFRD